MARDMKKIGILGVGHLGSALVTGLMATDRPPALVLSPRNAGRARALAERFGLEIARSSAGLVERSDVVLVATRPPDVLTAVRGLPWRPGHTVVSVASGIGLSALERSVRPATAVRALPLTAASIRKSPTCLFPDDAVAHALFERLGTVHAFNDEATFDLASIHGVVYSVFHAVIGSTVQWFESSGVPGTEARQLCTMAVRAAADMIVARPGVSIESMVEEFARPGSLTLAALSELRRHGVLDGLPLAWRAAHDRGRETGTGP